MKAILAGKSIRLRSEHPVDDCTLREMQLPRAPGLMPDNALAVELTVNEAWTIARNLRHVDNELSLMLHNACMEYLVPVLNGEECGDPERS